MMRKPDAWMAAGSGFVMKDGSVMHSDYVKDEHPLTPLYALTDAERAVLDAIWAGTHAIDRILALAEKATPGPWAWWTSNSVKRLSHERDGDILYAYRPHLGDPAADLCISQEDMALIEAVPEMVALIRELSARVSVQRYALEQIAPLYGQVWDRTDGGISMFGESIVKFDRAMQSVFYALGNPLRTEDGEVMGAPPAAVLKAGSS